MKLDDLDKAAGLCALLRDVDERIARLAEMKEPTFERPWHQGVLRAAVWHPHEELPRDSVTFSMTFEGVDAIPKGERADIIVKLGELGVEVP